MKIKLSNRPGSIDSKQVSWGSTWIDAAFFVKQTFWSITGKVAIYFPILIPLYKRMKEKVSLNNNFFLFLLYLFSYHQFLKHVIQFVAFWVGSTGVSPTRNWIIQSASALGLAQSLFTPCDAERGGGGENGSGIAIQRQSAFERLTFAARLCSTRLGFGGLINFFIEFHACKTFIILKIMLFKSHTMILMWWVCVCVFAMMMMIPEVDSLSFCSSSP